MTAEPSGMQEPFEPEFDFSKGQRVRIVEGPLTAFVGSVSESQREQKKVTVLISSFGKETPYVFDFLEVEQIERFFPEMKASTTQRTRHIRSHAIRLVSLPDVLLSGYP